MLFQWSWETVFSVSTDMRPYNESQIQRNLNSILHWRRKELEWVARLTFKWTALKKKKKKKNYYWKASFNKAIALNGLNRQHLLLDHVLIIVHISGMLAFYFSWRAHNSFYWSEPSNQSIKWSWCGAAADNVAALLQSEAEIEQSWNLHRESTHWTVLTEEVQSLFLPAEGDRIM